MTWLVGRRAYNDILNILMLNNNSKEAESAGIMLPDPNNGLAPPSEDQQRPRSSYNKKVASLMGQPSLTPREFVDAVLEENPDLLYYAPAGTFAEQLPKYTCVSPEDGKPVTCGGEIRFWSIQDVVMLATDLGYSGDVPLPKDLNMSTNTQQSEV